MRRLKKSIILSAAIILFHLYASDRAHAITFNPPEPSIFEFGDVVIGQSRQIDWSFSWSNDIGEAYIHLTYLTGQRGPFHLARNTSGCVTEGGICEYSLTYTPTNEDTSVAIFNDAIFFYDPEHDKSLYYTFVATGSGVNATPLPAALPLFASGLGAIGVVGWRRKKRVGARAAA